MKTRQKPTAEALLRRRAFYLGVSREMLRTARDRAQIMNPQANRTGTPIAAESKNSRETK